MESAGAFSRVTKRTSVSALAEKGLDETLRLAVGTRSVRPGAQVLKVFAGADESKGIGAIAGAVIGEELVDGDSEFPVVGNGTA